MRLRAIAATTAAAATLVLGPVAAGPAHAAPASCSGWIDVGNSGPYMYGGTYAGYVVQQYDTCNGYVGARWHWDSNFYGYASQHGFTVKLYVGSPYPGGWTYPDYDKGASWGQDVDYHPPIDHAPSGLSEDIWRAGAEINDSTCVEWGSLHNYANGGETDPSPQGGCNDRWAPM